MSKKKKESAEFRFYELSNDKPALVLIGDKWKQIYVKILTICTSIIFLKLGTVITAPAIW